MHIPSSPKLLAGLIAVCLAGCQCGPAEPALQVVINIEPGIAATCVVLEASAGGSVRLKQELSRPAGKNAYRVGIKKQSLPATLTLIARSYTSGTGSGCVAPLVQTSASAELEAKFPASDVATFTLDIRSPDASLDGDRDGHIDLTKGGDDCLDTDAQIHPGLPAACGSAVDNDCDSKIGCTDSECATSSICNMPPVGLAFITTPAPVSVNACSPALTVELRGASMAAVLAATDTPVAISAVPQAGVTLFSDPGCLTAVTQVTIPNGQSRASFHFKASAPGMFDATAIVTGLPTASQAQTVTPTAVTQLVFTTAPMTVPAGMCTGQLTLQTRDAAGVATPVSAATTIALSSDQAAVAFFSDASCTSSLGGMLGLAAGSSGGSFFVRATAVLPTTLTATLGALPPANQSLTVTAGPAAMLAFATSAQGVASAVCSSLVTVETRDAANNLTPLATASSITLSSTGVPIGLFSDSGCTTLITAPVTVAAGASSIGFYFRGSVAGMATITAAATGLTSALQTENIGGGPPSQLAFSAAQTVTAGQCSGSATIQSQDLNGNPSNVAAPLAVTFTGPASGFTFYSNGNCTNALPNPLTIPMGGTTATFFFKGTVAGPQAISATATALTAAMRTHTVNAAAPTALVFTSVAPMGFPITCAQFDLEARDVYGNPSAPVAATALSLTSAPAVTFSAATGCAASVTSVGFTGATARFFANSTVAGAKTLTATAPFAFATQIYTVSAGLAAQLGFITQPSNTVAGAAVAPSVRVAIQDSFGNPITTSTASVTVAIGANPSAGVLAGTATVGAVAGIATFSTLAINKVGTGYTLAATSTTLTGATSATFNITVGAAAQLAFTVQPLTTVAGVSIAPAVRVAVQDSQGNPVTASTASVTVAIDTNPGTGVLTGTLTTAAVAGVATFSTLSINKSGVGYTLGATSGALTAAASAAFNIDPGAAAKLTFSVQPTTADSNTSIAPAIQVTVQDALGNTANSTANVTMAIGTNPNTGVLSGTLTVAAIAGVATFSNLSINKSGVGYTLNATSGTLTAATSTAFTIIANTATQLAFLTQPTNAVAGASIAPSVRVAVQDAVGNTVTTSVANVTLAIAANPSAGVLAGTLTVAAVAGVATFSNLAINKVGTGYTLGATTGTLTPATSTAFNITVGPAAKLAFTVEPTNALAGVTIAASPRVTVQDSQGNTITGSTASVTVAIGTNPSGGVLSGTVTVAAVAGVATFSTLSINRAGVGYTLGATSGALAAAVSAAFDITPGPPAKLAFTVQPTNTVAGSPVSPGVEVTIQDALINTILTSTANVTLAIANNPSAGVLSGTVTVAAFAGVAVFSTLSINKSGVGYTLGASSGALAAATSGAFRITPGSAAALAFTVQPGNSSAGALIAPAVQVAIVDGLGNTVTSSTASVTIGIGTNPGTGVLSGTATVAAIAGLASFSTLSINKSGTGYTLGATSGALTPATSTAFNINPGAAAGLAFTAQPTTAVAGAAIAPAVQVTVQDAQGNTVTGSTANVTIAIATNPSAGVLSGTLTVAAVAGVATFFTLSINRAGTGYTLGATSGALTAATSASFNINVGAAAKLGFTVEPVTTTAGAAIAPAVQVSIQDAQGNTVTASTANVTIAIGTNPGTGVLSGTLTVAAALGVASFSTLSIDKSAIGYTLGVTSAGLTAATSTAFNINSGPAAQLAFTVQPTNAVAGAAVTPAVQVTVQDSVGNTVIGSTASIALAIGTNPSGGTLSGTVTIAAVAGVATFANLSIDKSGTGYTLGATSGALTPAASNAFNIAVGPAAKLAFTVQPTNAAAGVIIDPAIKVTVQDSQGNTVTSSTANVVVAIGTNPGAGVLSGTVTIAAVAGVATFSNLSINKSGIGYTLGATSGALTAAVSAAFDITAGAATKVAFLVQPVTTEAVVAISPSPQVEVQDALNNRVLGSTASVTLAIGTNPGTGVLSGTVTVAAVNGVATFPGLSIDKTGAGYTLAATSVPLTAATSSAFNITAGAAAKLAFTVQPTNAVSTGVIAPAIQVTVQDAQGNTVTGSTVSIVLAIGTNPGSGTLSGTTTVAAIAGVASFSTLSIDKAGIGYTLGASSGALTAATSSTFDIAAGPSAKLAYTSAAQTAVVAGACSAPVDVVIEDASGNPTPSSGNTQVNIAALPGATYYAGPGCSGVAVTKISIANGVTSGTFSFKITATGPAIVNVNATGLTSANQTETIIADVPTTTVMSVTTMTALASACSAATTVTVKDQFGNNANGPFTVNLATVAPNLTFYSDATCTTALASGALPIAIGSSTATYYWKAITGTYAGAVNTPYTVNATGTGVTTVGTQAETVNNTVRAGTCTSTTTTATCTLTPVVTDLTKAFFFFQNVNANGSSEGSNVRCVLTNTTTITCTRQLNTNNIDIQYYLVEYPSGITVQHLNPVCAAGATNTQAVPVTTVNTGSTFVLLSSEHGNTSQNDPQMYKSVSLTSATNVQITYGGTTPCVAGERVSLQVVDFAGAATVKAGSTASMGAGSYTGASGSIPGGPAVLNRSFLLYSWRLASPTGSMCNQMLRGELDSTSTAAFSRGDGSASGSCNSSAITEINWQRVEMPVGTVVSAQTLELATAALTGTSAAFTAVDPTRTAAFSGGQWASGQSNGETDYTGNDTAQTSRAKSTLSGANTTLTFTRAATGTSKAKWTSYVVQFLP